MITIFCIRLNVNNRNRQNSNFLDSGPNQYIIIDGSQDFFIYQAENKLKCWMREFDLKSKVSRIVKASVIHFVNPNQLHYALIDI